MPAITSGQLCSNKINDLGVFTADMNQRYFKNFQSSLMQHKKLPLLTFDLS